jgi:hypothetical protein
VSVTRSELANHIQAAFTAGPATRDSLLAYAASSRARPAVIAMIHALPDKTYPTIDALWQHMCLDPIAKADERAVGVGSRWPDRTGRVPHRPVRGRNSTGYDDPWTL